VLLDYLCRQAHTGREGDSIGRERKCDSEQLDADERRLLRLRSSLRFPANGVMRNFESPEHAFGAGDVFETATPL
jgi:hypothetical protein